MSTLTKRNLILTILILTIIITALSIYNMHTTNTRLQHTVTSLSIQLESAKHTNTTQVTTNTHAATTDNTTNNTLTIPFKITHHTNNAYEAVPLTSNTDKPILFFNQSDIIDNKQLKVNDTINAYYIELPGEDQFTKVDIKQSYTPKPSHKAPVTQLKVSTPKQTHHTKATIIDDDDLSGTESMTLESIDNEGYIFSNKNGGSYLSMNQVYKFNLIDLPIGAKVNITFNYNGDITKVDK